MRIGETYQYLGTNNTKALIHRRSINEYHVEKRVYMRTGNGWQMWIVVKSGITRSVSRSRMLAKEFLGCRKLPKPTIYGDIPF